MASAPFDTKAMRLLLDVHDIEGREKVFELFKTPVFDLNIDHGLSLKEKRKLTYDRCVKIAESGLMDVEEFTENAWRSQAVIEALSYHDASAQVRFGVHIGLFGASILRMGTEKHKQKYMKDINSYKIKGCFAMTELGHGSNVQQILTTATFDKKNDEFVLHTPNDLAQKFWIGGLAEYGNTAVVFAQLIIGDQNYGVHPFVVPLRDNAGNTLPGVTIADVGPKTGCQGIDNGRLWLDNVRIPRDNLLNKHNDVDRDGNYHSPYKSSGERFLANMTALLGARGNVGICCTNSVKIGITIAVKYGLTRRQFGNKGEEESLIIDYYGHQKRLFYILATTYALVFYGNYAKKLIIDNLNNPAQKQLHEVAASIKVYGSQFMSESLQTCRECCGGQGYSAYNRIGSLRSDWDLQVTVDGANFILYQQVAKGCLDALKNSYNRDEMVDGVTQQQAGITKVDVSCPQFWKNLFQLRFDFKLLQLTDALASRVEKGVMPKDAWDQSMDYIWGFGDAYSEKKIYDSFLEVFSGINDEAIKKALYPLLILYALRCWEKDMGWFATHVTAFQKVDNLSIRDEILDYCNLIRPISLPLVDSFGIPDHLLGPIAGDWLSYYAKSKL